MFNLFVILNLNCFLILRLISFDPYLIFLIDHPLNNHRYRVNNLAIVFHVSYLYLV